MASAMVLGRGLLVVCLAMTACGGSGQSSPRGGSGAGAQSAGSPTQGGTGGTEASGGTTQSDDPDLCGGAYRAECKGDKVCVFEDGCGTVGHCVRRPSSCNDPVAEVCGCDGETYQSACAARLVGVSPGTDGTCGDTFECGPHRCAAGQYCLDKGEQGDAPWRYACRPLPEGCKGKPSCDCIVDEKACAAGYACQTIVGSLMLSCN